MGDGAFPQGSWCRAGFRRAHCFLAFALSSLEGDHGQLQPKKKGGADIGSFSQKTRCQPTSAERRLFF